MMTGTRQVAGEFKSERYPGYLERPNGVFRKPRRWINPQGEERSANSYYVERNCDVCGALHLSDVNNKTAKRRICGSKACFAAVRSAPDGTTKRKRGPADANGHILAKAASHPAAKKGFVPQHRIVMENELGVICNQQSSSTTSTASRTTTGQKT